jgi:excisionase family DNA binding protein
MSAVLDEAVLPTSAGQSGLDAARIAADRGTGLVLTLSDGTQVALPEQLRDVLRDAATAVAEGQAVSVTPINTVLTTQQAAELLGVTRPTLVRLLESGEIPFTRPGRHRRVLLEDLKAFQSRRREVRRAALLEMTAEATDQEFDAADFVDTR